MTIYRVTVCERVRVCNLVHFDASRARKGEKKPHRFHLFEFYHLYKNNLYSHVYTKLLRWKECYITLYGASYCSSTVLKYVNKYCKYIEFCSLLLALRFNCSVVYILTINLYFSLYSKELKSVNK